MKYLTLESSPRLFLGLLLLLVAALLLSLTGCSTNANSVKKFVASLPAIDMAEARHDFKSPLWSNSESARNVKVDDGALKIASADSTFSIPLWGVSNTVILTGLSLKPSAAQLAKAEQVHAALAAKAAETKAAAP